MGVLSAKDVGKGGKVVKDVMSGTPISLQADATISDAAHLMIKVGWAAAGNGMVAGEVPAVGECAVASLAQVCMWHWLTSNRRCPLPPPLPFPADPHPIAACRTRSSACLWLTVMASAPAW